MPARKSSPFDVAVLACGVLGVALVWVPFYRDAYAGQSLSLWDLRLGRPRGFWIAAVEVALMLLAAIAVAVVVAGTGDSQRGSARRWLRWIALSCATAAVVVALVSGFLAASRAETGTACFGFATSKPTLRDCSRLGVDRVPSVGWVLALIMSVTAMIAAATGLMLRKVAPLRSGVSPRTLTGMSYAGALLVVVGAGTPVFRRDGVTYGAERYPGYVFGQTALHSPYAIAAVMFALVTAGLTRWGPGDRRLTRVGALLVFLAALAAGAALPVGDGTGHRMIEGVRTIVSITRLGWGFSLLLAGSLLLLAAHTMLARSGSAYVRA